MWPTGSRCPWARAFSEAAAGDPECPASGQLAYRMRRQLAKFGAATDGTRPTREKAWARHDKVRWQAGQPARRQTCIVPGRKARWRNATVKVLVYLRSPAPWLGQAQSQPVGGLPLAPPTGAETLRNRTKGASGADRHGLTAGSSWNRV